MPSPLTIKKYISNTNRQIVKQRKKYENSKHTNDKLAAKDKIKELKSKLLYFEQLLAYNNAN